LKTLNNDTSSYQESSVMSVLLQLAGVKGLIVNVTW